MASSDPSTAFGWTAYPRSFKKLLDDRKDATAPQPVRVEDVALPASKLASAVKAYAEKELPEGTYNHSMRVFYYGMAIAKYNFPEWTSASFAETYFLTCLLHDIGTTDKHIAATRMSFEFYGGMVALSVVQKEGGPLPQAESVAEAVMRHQDLGETGTLSAIGALIQLATIFDNVGGNPELVHRDTIENVVRAHPRNKWSQCFAKTIRKELDLKPWAHTSHLGNEDFPEGVLANKLMEPWE